MKRIEFDWNAELRVEVRETHTLAQMVAVVQGNRCYRHVTLAAVEKIGSGQRLFNPVMFLGALENSHGSKCWFCDEAGSFPTPATYFERDPGVLVCCGECRHIIYLRHGAWALMLRRRFNMNWLENGFGEEPGDGEWFKTYAALRSLTDLTGGAASLNMGIRVSGAN